MGELRPARGAAHERAEQPDGQRAEGGTRGLPVRGREPHALVASLAGARQPVRSHHDRFAAHHVHELHHRRQPGRPTLDRKSTRLNSSHLVISYAVFCLKKKKKKQKFISKTKIKKTKKQ